MSLTLLCVCFRDVFLSTIQPQRKQVVIMMDQGNSMSLTQLRTAKAIAKHLIASFSHNDRVRVTPHRLIITQRQGMRNTSSPQSHTTTGYV